MLINKNAAWVRIDVDDVKTYPKPREPLLFMRKRPEGIEEGAPWWNRFYGAFDGRSVRPDLYPAMRFPLTEIEAWMSDRILNDEDMKNLESVRYRSIR